MPRLVDIGCLVTCASPDGQGEIGEIADAALVWKDGEVAWAGPAARLPGSFGGEPIVSAEGRLVVPGLVDCHTHLGFGGWRAGEFTDRIRGRSYLDIAKAGGGIASTVHATRDLGERALFERCRSFAGRMVELGVTTIECKSGYGLDRDTELRLLRVYRQLSEEGPARIVSTFLGAHVVPPEYADRRAAYVGFLTDEMIPIVSKLGLAEFCDAFVEAGAFTPREAREVLSAAAAAGLGLKLHADQLSDGGGARLAAELGAVSADHLECVSSDGIEALARAGVVAVTLPIATLYLGQEPPPARDLIEAGVAVAVATDFNPGTAPSYDLPLAMLLACTRQRMTPAETLKGVTRYAARAIGLEGRVGSLEPGSAADFAVLDAPDVEHWMYHHRPGACVATCVGGVTVAGSLPRG